MNQYDNTTANPTIGCELNPGPANLSDTVMAIDGLSSTIGEKCYMIFDHMFGDHSNRDRLEKNKPCNVETELFAVNDKLREVSSLLDELIFRIGVKK